MILKVNTGTGYSDNSYQNNPYRYDTNYSTMLIVGWSFCFFTQYYFEVAKGRDLIDRIMAASATLTLIFISLVVMYICVITPYP